MVGGDGRIRNWVLGASSRHAESELGPTARDPDHRSIGIRARCARRRRAPQGSAGGLTNGTRQLPGLMAVRDGDQNSGEFVYNRDEPGSGLDIVPVVQRLTKLE
jgi:hypothetical protein